MEKFPRSTKSPRNKYLIIIQIYFYNFTKFLQDFHQDPKFLINHKINHEYHQQLLRDPLFLSNFFLLLNFNIHY